MKYTVVVDQSVIDEANLLRNTPMSSLNNCYNAIAIRKVLNEKVQVGFKNLYIKRNRKEIEIHLPDICGQLSTEYCTEKIPLNLPITYEIEVP